MAFAGIGLGIALAFLAKGSQVVLVSRSYDKMQAATPDKYQKAQDSKSASTQEGKAHFVAKDLTTVPFTAWSVLGNANCLECFSIV